MSSPLYLFLKYAILILILWSSRGLAAPTVPREESGRVVVLANANDPESLALATAYAEARMIPKTNIAALPMPSSESISWRQFVDAVWTPLQDQLIEKKWITAGTSGLLDPVGRRKRMVFDHRISYLVVCRGIPLRIENDPSVFFSHPQASRNQHTQRNDGAVDSELSLLAVPMYPINGFVPNPLFNLERAPLLNEARIIRVSRLDGPTFEDARNLFESALYAEEYGLVGSSAIDLGGPHAMGDRWLEETLAQLRVMGYSSEVERTQGRFGAESRLGSLAWYFGWYTENLDGPFLAPDFRFARGSIALHIHSFSGVTLHSTTRGWLGPLVARGVTGTFGNVAEPYLEFSHQPQKIVQALAKGRTLGDAAYYALNVLSWQAIVIGDPLYRPFPDQAQAK